MAVKGKGFYIWKVLETEQGNANAIANAAQQAGFSHVLIKAADGNHSYNVDSKSGADLVAPVITALHARGIQAYVWHYVYGYDPLGEARIAIQRVQELKADGYAIDAEAEYSQAGRDAAARQFMSALRASLPNLPIVLSSYRYPSYHPQLPWQAFLEKCDYNMPQVYWMQNHNAGEQLIRSVREFQAFTPYRPIIPTGAAFTESGWSPTVDDELEFLQTAQSLNLTGANFWEWSNCRQYLPAVWDAIQNYPWTTTPLPKDITQQYIDALNTHDSIKVEALYTPTAVHINARRTIQGAVALHAWFDDFFRNILPNAVFTLSGFNGSGNSRHFTWTAKSGVGSVSNGSDTLGLSDGRIAYHFSTFTVTK
jgi:SnoaL-like domain